MCSEKDCINCDIPTIDPEDCESCKRNAEENGFEYEHNVTWKNGMWVCDNCNRGV